MLRQSHFSLVKFCNNTEYYRKLYGKYLRCNCSCIESLQKEYYQDTFEFKPPEYTNRRTIFNCIREAGLFKWENDLFSCNHTIGKASLNIIHPPVYPGQSITLTLLHLQKSIRMYPDFPILNLCSQIFCQHATSLISQNMSLIQYMKYVPTCLTQ